MGKLNNLTNFRLVLETSFRFLLHVIICRFGSRFYKCCKLQPAFCIDLHSLSKFLRLRFCSHSAPTYKLNISSEKSTTPVIHARLKGISLLSIQRVSFSSKNISGSGRWFVQTGLVLRG